MIDKVIARMDMREQVVVFEQQSAIMKAEAFDPPPQVVVGVMAPLVCDGGVQRYHQRHMESTMTAGGSGSSPATPRAEA